MGCDIHIVVQRLQNGKWQTIDDAPKFDGRSYLVFGILADVRGRGFEAIDDPRGLPKDFAYHNAGGDQYDYFHNDTWLGDHNHSWLKLSEILDYDWDQEYEPDDNELTLREACKYFLEYIDKLKALDSNADNVRLVFGFDS